MSCTTVCASTTVHWWVVERGRREGLAGGGKGKGEGGMKRERYELHHGVRINDSALGRREDSMPTGLPLPLHVCPCLCL